MSSLFEELDYRDTALGRLILRRRTMATLADTVVYEVILDDDFLMTSLFHTAEEALADLGIAAVSRRSLDVVVGGLGLGYTAAAALRHPEVHSLHVIDYLQPVIDWHRTGLVPLGSELCCDSRCRLIHADFFALAAPTGSGFDPDRPGRRFDAVLLDIDHSPDQWLDPVHAVFYSASGLRALRSRLLPGGVFAMWSDGAPQADFTLRLRQVFSSVRAETVRFPNPIQGGESSSTVYVAVS